MRCFLLLLLLSVTASAQNYEEWTDDSLREELGRLAEATRKINVPMRDGVNLSTDVYLPKGAASDLPAVFWRP